MDWPSIISEIGGGLPAVVIIALGVAVAALWRRINNLHDARISDQKEHAAQMLENTRTLETAMRLMEGRNG